MKSVQEGKNQMIEEIEEIKVHKVDSVYPINVFENIFSHNFCFT